MLSFMIMVTKRNTKLISQWPFLHSTHQNIRLHLAHKTLQFRRIRIIKNDRILRDQPADHCVVLLLPRLRADNNRPDAHFSKLTNQRYRLEPAAYIDGCTFSLKMRPVFLQECPGFLFFLHSKSFGLFDRLRITNGVVNQHIDEIELYRVKDTLMVRTWWMRLTGLATLTLQTSDRSLPHLVIPAIANGVDLREQLRKQVELQRDSKRVREMDFDETGHASEELDADLPDGPA